MRHVFQSGGGYGSSGMGPSGGGYLQQSYGITSPNILSPEKKVRRRCGIPSTDKYVSGMG